MKYAREEAISWEALWDRFNPFPQGAASLAAVMKAAVTPNDARCQQQFRTTDHAEFDGRKQHLQGDKNQRRFQIS